MITPITPRRRHRAVFVIAHVLARLPLGLLQALGAVLGLAVYCLSRRMRRRVRENLDQAGYRTLRDRLVVATSLGAALLEVAAIWLRPLDQALAFVREVVGWKVIEEARALGRGVIFITPHLGCFEISALYVGERMPLTVLYRPPRIEWIEPMMLAGRSRTVKMVTTDVTGVRQVIRALRRHETVGLLPDQVPDKGDGEWTSFFDRPAYTMTLAARLAEATDAPIVVVFAERLRFGRGFRLHFAPLPERLPGERPVRQMTRALEALIRRAPAQYLWSYNRYKVPRGVALPGDQSRAEAAAAEAGDRS